MGAHIHKRQNTRSLFTTSSVQESIAPTSTTIEQTVLTGFISAPPTIGTTISKITLASSTTVYTIVTNTITNDVPASNSNGPQPTASTQTLTFSDQAQYASYMSAQVTASTATSSQPLSSTTNTTLQSTSSSTSSKSSSSNSSSGTLIPAIVVPVAVVLLASFILFWFFMRRRHHREVKKANFVMTGARAEKLESKTNSTRSGSSAGDRMVMKDLPTVASHPITLSRDDDPLTPPPAYQITSNGEIGIARALTPEDTRSHHSASPRSPHIAQFAGPRNFNSPQRPGIMGQHAHAPPNPSVWNGQRDRSRISPHQRGPQPNHASHNRAPGPSYDRRSPPGPASAHRSSPLGARSSPTKETANSATNFQGPRSVPRLPPQAMIRGPSPAFQNGPGPAVGNGVGQSRAPPPAPIDLTPLGAFNGAGPISQYSPIVKEVHREKKPLQLRTSNPHRGESLPDASDDSDNGSPVARVGLGLSDENWKTASSGGRRLSGEADNSPQSPFADPPYQEASSPEHVSGAAYKSLSEDKEHQGDTGEADVLGTRSVRSSISSLHETERFDFDNWSGAGDSRRASQDLENGYGGGPGDGRVSPIQYGTGRWR